MHYDKYARNLGITQTESYISSLLNYHIDDDGNFLNDNGAVGGDCG